MFPRAGGNQLGATIAQSSWEMMVAQEKFSSDSQGSILSGMGGAFAVSTSAAGGADTMSVPPWPNLLAALTQARHPISIASNRVERI